MANKDKVENCPHADTRTENRGDHTATVCLDCGATIAIEPN